MNHKYDKLIEVELVDPDNFLKIKETLTRIGILRKRDKTLFQTAHILHSKKYNKFYIVHFKELFMLDGRKFTDFTPEDEYRRFSIAELLEDWGLLKIIDGDTLYSKFYDEDGYSKVEVKNKWYKILPYEEKHKYNLSPKYMIGDNKKGN